MFFIQESHSVHEDEQKWADEWGGKIFFSHGESNSRGVATGFTSKFDGTIGDISRDKNGRILIIELTTQDTRYLLINVYNGNTVAEQIKCFHNSSV